MAESWFDGIRKRPGMWVGSTGAAGLLNLLLEVVSNSLDLVMAGTADVISVSTAVGGMVSITDNGRGMSVDSTLVEEVFTVPRRTPTMDGHQPHVHLAFGIGLAPVNALCRRVEIEVRTDEGVFTAAFGRGQLLDPLTRVSDATNETGTTVRLWPDSEIFGTTSVDVDAFRTRMTELTWIRHGLVVEFDGEPIGPTSDLSEMFHGLREYGHPMRLSHEAPLMIVHEDDDASVELALGWRENGAGLHIRSFCNFRELAEPGVQHLGIEEGLRLALGQAPMGEVLRRTAAALNIVMLDPEIGGPTRSRLDSPEAVWLIADAIAEQLPGLLAKDAELAADLRSIVPWRNSSQT